MQFLMNEKLSLQLTESAPSLCYKPTQWKSVFILEGTGGGSAGSPSCPWLCCTPSYSFTILQRAVEVTEDTFTPFNVFWLPLKLDFELLDFGVR